MYLTKSKFLLRIRYIILNRKEGGIMSNQRGNKDSNDGSNSKELQSSVESKNEKVRIIVKKDGEEIRTDSPVSDKLKLVIVINNQFTSAPNTTQIASGAGRNSAAGSNAAIDSSNTDQQQSVGAQGVARNSGMKGEQTQPHEQHEDCDGDEEIVIIINNQVNKGQRQSSATQVASGSGLDSTGGTNSAIGSSNTKQQHAVGGGGRAINKGENGDQEEK